MQSGAIVKEMTEMRPFSDYSEFGITTHRAITGSESAVQ